MNKMRQWSMLTGLAVVVVLAAGWFLAVSPQRHHAADLRTQAATQASSNASLLAQVDQLKQQKQGLPAQQRLLDQIAAKVPDNPALPALIRELSTAANAAGVDLVSMAPSPPVAVTASAPTAPVAATTGTTGTTAGTTPAVGTAVTPLNQIQVSLNVKGSYFNVESFFAAVEKIKRAMRVTGFSIAPGATSSSTSTSSSTAGSPSVTQLPPDTLTATITALVYESPSVAPPTQAAPVAPAAASK
jgi:Tfp pilus assembly protein PilO